LAERLILSVIIFGSMLVEAARASANERRQRARGGREPSGDVYTTMRFVYPAAFGAMLIEGALRGAPPMPVALAGAVIFLTAKALKWWAIVSLGPFWTFRVIVVPGDRSVPLAAAPELRRGDGRAGRRGPHDRRAMVRLDRNRDVRLARDSPCVRGRTGAPRRRSLSL
jgi:hypothetical protein